MLLIKLTDRVQLSRLCHSRLILVRRTFVFINLQSIVCLKTVDLILLRSDFFSNMGVFDYDEALNLRKLQEIHERKVVALQESHNRLHE